MRKDGKEIGELIRDLRKSRGMTQMQLAERVGVSYQQIQKYEKGGDTISAQRLKQISKALDVSMNIFFPTEGRMIAETPAIYGKLHADESLLLKYYRGIKDKKVKKAVLQFMRTLAVNIAAE